MYFYSFYSFYSSIFSSKKHIRRFIVFFSKSTFIYFIFLKICCPTSLTPDVQWRGLRVPEGGHGGRLEEPHRLRPGGQDALWRVLPVSVLQSSHSSLNTHLRPRYRCILRFDCWWTLRRERGLCFFSFSWCLFLKDPGLPSIRLMFVDIFLVILCWTFRTVFTISELFAGSWLAACCWPGVWSTWRCGGESSPSGRLY